ncbi:MAG TPA: GDSL-type esterase/lipase family protein [Phycisphaerae bacterium]|nr:GDSL-type esterase/lipase family protein [Phycisphaerae bacterium]
MSSRHRLAVAWIVAAGLVVGLGAAAWGQDGTAVILDMDTVRHKPTEVTDKDKQKVPAGTVEQVDGKVGKACRFAFREATSPGFMTLWVTATAEWDLAEGLSFWVKGDGSSHWGGLELVDGENYALRYGYCFPIDSTEWRKVVVPWRDLVPVWFGFNDWDSGVRGERFAEYLRLAVDRIRRATKGGADVVLMTTCPAHARWDTMNEMAEAVRAVAAEKKTALADVAAVFHKAPGPDEALKQGYWAWDKTHLGPKGHEVACEAVIAAIESGQ